MPRGFTLIETIMVIVITLIIGFALFLRWNPFWSIKLDGAARKIEGDIRYTQKLSISTQTRAGIIFYTNGYEVYELINGPSAAIANSPGDSCSKDANGKFVVDFTQPRCSDLSGVTLSFLNNAIAFDSIGRLVNSSTESSEPLITQTITVNYKGTKSIVIEEGTGRVSH